jgi:hypothetical protein
LSKNTAKKVKIVCLEAIMRRRKELPEEELKLITKKISDDEALEMFFRDCHLRNLKPATIEYYRTNFMLLRNS